MSHKAALEALFPLTVEPNSVFDQDFTVEGSALDSLYENAQGLLPEMRAQTAAWTISDYEARYNITPKAGDTLQQRQATVLAKIRARGGLSIPYFTALAATLGYTIAIEELPPNSTDPDVPEGAAAASIYIWRIHPVAAANIYFRVGRSRVGEHLVTSPTATALQGLFEALKPDHTMLIWADS